MMRSISPTIQTLFADLAQQVDTAPISGSPYRRERDGVTYHYAKIPVGSTRVDSFIGRVGDPVADRQAGELARGMALAKQRRTTVSMLKRNLAAPDQMLGAIMDAIAHAGLFRNGAVLVGTTAYMLYEPLVGSRLPAPTLRTGDLDLATLSLHIGTDRQETIATVLARADPTFSGVLHLDPRQPPSRFQSQSGYLVDLVTQMRTQDDSNPVPLERLGAGAAPLQHMAWLIAEPATTVALWGAGIAVRVPQPARYAVHKLILAQKRPAGDRIKRAKDLAQADALRTALLAFDPFALEDALDDARAQGKAGWSDPIDRSLAEIERGLHSTR